MASCKTFRSYFHSVCEQRTPELANWICENTDLNKYFSSLFNGPADHESIKEVLEVTRQRGFARLERQALIDSERKYALRLASKILSCEPPSVQILIRTLEESLKKVIEVSVKKNVPEDVQMACLDCVRTVKGIDWTSFIEQIPEFSRLSQMLPAMIIVHILNVNCLSFRCSDHDITIKVKDRSILEAIGKLISKEANPLVSLALTLSTPTDKDSLIERLREIPIQSIERILQDYSNTNCKFGQLIWPMFSRYFRCILNRTDWNEDDIASSFRILAATATSKTVNALSSSSEKMIDTRAVVGMLVQSISFFPASTCSVLPIFIAMVKYSTEKSKEVVQSFSQLRTLCEFEKMFAPEQSQTAFTLFSFAICKYHCHINRCVNSTLIERAIHIVRLARNLRQIPSVQSFVDRCTQSVSGFLNTATSMTLKRLPVDLLEQCICLLCESNKIYLSQVPLDTLSLALDPSKESMVDVVISLAKTSNCELKSRILVQVADFLMAKTLSGRAMTNPRLFLAFLQVVFLRGHVLYEDRSDAVEIRTLSTCIFIIETVPQILIHTSLTHDPCILTKLLTFAIYQSNQETTIELCATALCVESLTLTSILIRNASPELCKEDVFLRILIESLRSKSFSDEDGAFSAKKAAFEFIRAICTEQSDHQHRLFSSSVLIDALATASCDRRYPLVTAKLSTIIAVLQIGCESLKRASKKYEQELMADIQFLFVLDAEFCDSDADRIECFAMCVVISPLFPKIHQNVLNVIPNFWTPILLYGWERTDEMPFIEQKTRQHFCVTERSFIVHERVRCPQKR
ncbi:hypothetical protein ACOME3_002724 [Neoechinorhynchus agilis]